MGAVGLLYVGAVLFVNGCALMGWVKGNGAVPLNIFVGLLQVITPTYLIFTSGGDADVIFGASGLYLFAFTYLYVALNGIWGFDGTGLGYFSLFVAVAAVGYSVMNFTRYDDYPFGVIWLYWAFLWFLFFLVLGLGRDHLTWYTGAVTAVEGWVTGAIPAFLLLTSKWQDLNQKVLAVVLAVIAVVVFGALATRISAARATAAV